MKKRKSYVDECHSDGTVSICNDNLLDGGNRTEKLKWWGIEALKLAKEKGYNQAVEEITKERNDAYRTLGIKP